MIPTPTKGTASPTGAMGNAAKMGSHMPAGGGPFAGMLSKIAAQNGAAGGKPLGAAPTAAPMAPSGGGMPSGANLSQLAQLFLSGPQKTMPAASATGGAGMITNPVYPTIQMPTPSKSVLPSQAATTAAPAAYQSQKGEIPLEGGGVYYNGLNYSPVGEPKDGMQVYSTGTGHDQKYLQLKV